MTCALRDEVPVVLFAYARPDHLRRVLACLQEDRVPLLYAFSDGAKGVGDQAAVEEVRRILRAVGWCDVRLHERVTNWGLGRSVLAGVTEVLSGHDSVIVFEDDLVFVPGTYAYLVAALRQYQDDRRVMSVSGWTHPRVTPAGVGDQPFFDGRAVSWSWGTWARAWQGLESDAQTLMHACQQRGIDVYRYGADLPETAAMERVLNVWAVRWAYLHLLRGGLCLRPPRSLVEHEGVDSLASNASGDLRWTNAPLRSRPPIPEVWPLPAEHPQCALLWQAAYGYRVSASVRWYRWTRWWLRRTSFGRLARGVLTGR